MSGADELIADARSHTGLDDLGEESFHEGLVALLDGADAAGTFNELGVAVLRDQAVGLLKTRLSVEDWYRRHPDIAEQQIVAPLFGLGLPRTGSTALSFLLAQDPRARSLLAWEASAPTPPPDPATHDTDPRIAESAAGIALIDEMAPKFKTMLPTSPTGPTECLQLMALDFRSVMFGALGDNRHYERWLQQCHMASAYRYHERVLKLLQWRFPTRPWRLKAPPHMASIEALLAVYPDARFVMTHRDIAEVVPSVVSLLDATSELLRTGPLAPDFAANQAEYWERALRNAVAYRDAGNEDRFFDIGFAEMRPDPIPAMQRLYGWLRAELPEDVVVAMRAWWASNPADQHGAHDYGPEQYGIDLDELRRRFAFYDDRFAARATVDALTHPSTDTTRRPATMDLGLDGATVVISGGTTGMGRAAADCFAQDGARVAVLARSREQLDATAGALTALGSPDAIGIETDLFDRASVDAAIAQVRDRWGHLNALVNAAGPMAGGLKSFETYSDDDWHSVFDGLTLGAVRTCRAALPLLRAAEWARIVNVSAMSTKRQSPPLIAYTASKSALTSLTKNLAQTLAPDGILVNTVSPGTFASESFKAALAEMPGVDENDLVDVMRFIGEGFGHHVFLDRAADPAEIGPVIAFAASKRNTYMTGANLNVDGGSDFT